MTSVAAPAYSFHSIIGGEDVRGAGVLSVNYPFTREQIPEVPLLTRQTVERALDLAAASRPALDRGARAQVLERVARSIASEGDDLARLITWESGLSLKDTRYEVRRAIDVFRFAAGEALAGDGG